MAITTYAELQTAIANWLNRDDLSAVIPDFITLAEAKFNREIRDYRMEETAALAVSTQYTALPADFLQPIRLTETGQKRNLELIGRPNMQERRYLDDDATGNPRFYTITDGQLEVFPTPGEAVTVNLLYYEQIPALSDSQTSNWLLATAPDIYLYGSLVHSAPYLADDKRAPTWAAFLQAAMDELELEGSRAKFGGAGINMRAPLTTRG